MHTRVQLKPGRFHRDPAGVLHAEGACLSVSADELQAFGDKFIILPGWESVDATVAAVELACAHDVLPADVTPTGAGGRYVKSDVESYLEGRDGNA